MDQITKLYNQLEKLKAEYQIQKKEKMVLGMIQSLFQTEKNYFWTNETSSKI